MNLVNQQEVISHYLKSEIGRIVEYCPIDSFHHQLAIGLEEFVQSATESELRKIVRALAVDYRQSSVYRELYNEETSEHGSVSKCGEEKFDQIINYIQQCLQSLLRNVQESSFHQEFRNVIGQFCIGKLRDHNNNEIERLVQGLALIDECGSVYYKAIFNGRPLPPYHPSLPLLSQQKYAWYLTELPVDHFLLPDMGSKQKSAIIECQRSPRKFVQFITSEKNRGNPEYQIFFESKVLRYPTVIAGYNQREGRWGNVIIDGGHRFIKMVMEGHTFISAYLGVRPMNIARWQQQYGIELCPQ